jgi:hypothetical protein
MRHSELARVRDMQAALAAQEQQLGADDPRTVDSRIRLVEAYEQLPDHDDEQRSWEELAAAEMAKAVDSRVRTLGPNHPNTLTIRYKLAFLQYHLTMNDVQHGAAGRADLVAALRGIADDRARVLGPTHPDTLQSWDMLSHHCPEPERPGLRERVVRGWEQVLAERERRLGPDDPETLAVLLQLAAQYRNRRAEDAQKLAQRAVAGWERITAERTRRLGPVHPDTVAARERHLELHDAYVRSGDGKRLFEAIVADHERLLGPDHPRTLRAQIKLLGWSGMPGDEDPQCAALAERLIDRVQAVLGPDHEDFRKLRYLLMATYIFAGRPDAADAVRRHYPSPSDNDFFTWEGPGATT